MAVRTPDDLQAYLDLNAVPAEIIRVQGETPTVQAAAEALNVVPEQIVKTVVFIAAGQAYAVLGCGLRRVDSKKLAAYLNIPRRHITLADAETVLSLTGYAVGTVPPVGHAVPMPVLMDETIFAHEVVYAGGGGIHEMLRMTPADLLRVTRAVRIDLLGN